MLLLCILGLIMYSIHCLKFVGNLKYFGVALKIKIVESRT
jgi:hypothetical protein